MNNADCNFNLHLIHNIVDKQSLDNFKEQFNSIYPEVTLTFYYIDINIPYINHRLKHVTIATMLQLYIPLKLNTIDKVLYLDIDVLVTGNLEYIWNLDCGETGLCLKSSINPSWKETNNYRCGNAGVMLMNLNTLRKNNFTEKILDFNLEKSEDDQALINKYAQGKYNNLEGNMNIFMNQDDNKYKDPIIYHLVGHKKPWNSLGNNILFELWHSYNNIAVSINNTNIRKNGIGINITNIKGIGKLTNPIANAI
jgi:lipopolysaccharide biosynthesis glycosyltransferase